MTDDDKDEKFVGLEVAPSDDQLESWLEEKLESATEEMEEIIQGLHEVVSYGEEQDEPYLFAFARLQNYLATLDDPVRQRALSAALWMIMEADR